MPPCAINLCDWAICEGEVVERNIIPTEQTNMMTKPKKKLPYRMRFLSRRIHCSHLTPTSLLHLLSNASLPAISTMRLKTPPTERRRGDFLSWVSETRAHCTFLAPRRTGQSYTHGCPSDGITPNIKPGSPYRVSDRLERIILNRSSSSSRPTQVCSCSAFTRSSSLPSVAMV